MVRMPAPGPAVAPGASFAGAATVTGPAMVPLPPSVPAVIARVPVPDPEPLTNRAPTPGLVRVWPAVMFNPPTVSTWFTPATSIVPLPVAARVTAELAVAAAV